MVNSKSSFPLVSFGVVNCNRLHYLKSCVESLVSTTSDYPNRELLVVDNASVEFGTDEYLKEIVGKFSNVHVRIFRQKTRDPSNEFARGLNLICREYKGDYLVLLQGDMQFTVNGWLNHYVDFYSEKQSKVGSIILDAQRKITIRACEGKMSIPLGETFPFVEDRSRPPVSCAGDAFYSRKIIDEIYPWRERNESHEGGGDSETDMIEKVRDICDRRTEPLVCVMPVIPVSVSIYTDDRGTNARVRGGKRYGDYWPPKESFTYYKIRDLDEAVMSWGDRKVPVGIEEYASPVGWKALIDGLGNWKKNPIRPESARESDFVDLQEPSEINPFVSKTSQAVKEPDYISSWMDG